MFVWLVALLFVVMAAVTGYFRGALRAAISFVGLVIALYLAGPVGEFFQPVIRFLGLEHPFILPFVSPVVVFVLISAAAKVVAASLHARVENHFKFSENHVRQVAFERVSTRAGASVGAMNGMVYAIALLSPFYVASYATLQLPESDSATMPIKLANSVGRAARETGFDKVLAGYGTAPKSYYSGTDLLASILNSPGIYSRIHLYPDTTQLAESPEIAQISSDTEAANLFSKKSALGDLLANPKVQLMVSKVAFVKQAIAKLSGDTTDLLLYLKTGTSPRFSEESLIGIWTHSPDDSLNEVRRKMATITTKEMARVRSTISANFTGGELTFFGNSKARLTTRDGTPTAKIQEATWKKESSGYLVQVADGNTPAGMPKSWDFKTLIVGDSLYVTKEETTYIFKRRL